MKQCIVLSQCQKQIQFDSNYHASLRQHKYSIRASSHSWKKASAFIQPILSHQTPFHFDPSRESVSREVQISGLIQQMKTATPLVQTSPISFPSQVTLALLSQESKNYQPSLSYHNVLSSVTAARYHGKVRDSGHCSGTTQVGYLITVRAGTLFHFPAPQPEPVTEEPASAPGPPPSPQRGRGNMENIIRVIGEAEGREVLGEPSVDRKERDGGQTLSFYRSPHFGLSISRAISSIR